MTDAYDRFNAHDATHDDQDRVLVYSPDDTTMPTPPALEIGGVYGVLGLRGERIELHIITEEIAYNTGNGHTWHTSELFEPIFLRMQDITPEEKSAAYLQEGADRASMWEAPIILETSERGINYAVREY